MRVLGYQTTYCKTMTKTSLTATRNTYAMKLSGKRIYWPPSPRLVAVVSYEYLLQATVELPDIGIDLTADLRWYSRPTQSRIVEVTLNGNPLNVTPQDEEAVLRCVTEYYQRHKNQSSSDAMRLLKSLLAQ